MENIWKIKAQAPEEFFIQNKDYPRPILQLLWNRGLKDKEAIEEFLQPSLAVLFSPNLMLNMEQGAKRIVQGIKNNERMAIFGDYDTDGICSSAILAKFFQRIGFENFDVFIPNRFKGGYGLTIEKVKEINQDGVNLIITVDCGITDAEEVKLAKSLGMEVLIFDHHLPPAILPDTLIVDVHQPGDSYPFKYLVATAVAYKLVQTLAQEVNFPFKESLAKEFLDFIAIATIADVAPLLEENRILVKFGLEQLKRTSNIGLKALLDVAGIGDQKNYTSYHIGFVIAPRLNAVGRVEHTTPAGRIEDTDYSFELLMTENDNEAQVWAKKIDAFNKDRQRQVEEIYNSVSESIRQQGGPEKVIFFGDPKWSKGIVGVVAGKLKDKWHRPAFIYSQTEEGTSLGSARSVAGFNLVEVMAKASQFFVECGGHSEAAGFTIKKESLEECHQFLEEQGELLLKDEGLVPVVEIESILEPEDITDKFWDTFRQFEPFGKSNPDPVFLMSDVRIDKMRPVGKNGNHLKMAIVKNGRSFNVISFNSVEKLSHLSEGMRVDLVFILRENEWQGRTYLDFELVDIKEIR
ncbi:MAG TPA: single-stranded-DNA-specific exonuclease RecJ [Candidatus Paceibacterota bacterium]|nr:single-stranded-DNA-specific exonuclease RecJ [Candidatus Paceibacterota bacterium]